MKYEYRLPKKVLGIWKDEHGNMWEYGEKEGVVFGEVRRKCKLESQTYLHVETYQIPVTPLRKKRRLFEKVIGYIPCSLEDEEGSICIVAPAYGKICAMILAVSIIVAGAISWMNMSMERTLQDEIIHVELPESIHNTDPEGYSIPDYTSIKKNINKDKTDTWLINVNGNPYDMSYEIYLKGESKALYQSPILGDGDVIKGMTLNQNLKQGNYEYTIICIFYSKGTQNEIGEQTMEGVLEVYDEA